MKKISLFFGLLILLQTALFAQDTLPAPSSYRVNKVSFNMVLVEQGGFWMGAQLNLLKRKTYCIDFFRGALVLLMFDINE